MQKQYFFSRAISRLKQLISLAALAVVAGCGGGGGGDSGASSTTLAPSPERTPTSEASGSMFNAPAPAPTVSISFSASSVAAGQSSTLTWSSTNASSCTASGAWSGTLAGSGTLAISQEVAGTYRYDIACTGAGGSVSDSATLAVTGGAHNVVLMTVDRGPLSRSFNVPFVSVTVCRPGTSICQTIDDVMVDTGSYGLRLMASELNSSLTLPAVTNAGGNALGECAQFVSGFTWGSVRKADVKLGGETASDLPIQIIGDTPGGYSGIPTACTSAGANVGSVSRLGAKGILGIGMFSQDCGSACVTSRAPGMYYACTASSCSGTMVALRNQVTNPVSAFAVDNNGVLLKLPSVPPGGTSRLAGTLVFGIGTQANNQLGGATVYAANSRGNFTTVYKGKSLTSSFIDSGSNGLFFEDETIQKCSTGFYCPTSTLSLSAVNMAHDGSRSGTVSFTVENVYALSADIAAAHAGGSLDLSGSFDWGLPFFFGRSVFVAMSGANTPGGTGPYWAY